MMDDPSDAPVGAPSDLDREAAALARSQRRLGVTQELAEIRLDLARALRAEVMARVSGVENAESERAPVFGDVSLAYSRISRAVRMTLALEATIDGDVQVRVGRVAAERYTQSIFDEAREAQDTRTKEAEMIREPVRWAIETDTAERGERGERERLYRELEEVLEDEHDWEMMAGKNLAEAVAYVCRELGVPFDAELWFSDEDEDEPGSLASEPEDPADPPDALDRALELANRGGEGAGPGGPGKTRPP
jgi:hypothetical protein